MLVIRHGYLVVAAEIAQVPHFLHAVWIQVGRVQGVLEVFLKTLGLVYLLEVIIFLEVFFVAWLIEGE